MDRTQRTIRWTAGLALGFTIVMGTAALIVARAEPQTPPAGARPEGRMGRFGPGGPGGRGGPGRFGGDGPLGAGLRMPGLTEEQRAQARGIAERYEPQTAPLRQQLLAAQQALDAAIATAPVDEGLIRQHAAEVAAASAELAVIRAHVRSEVAALLTPEQRQQQQERQARQEERRERMRERRQNGPGAGQ